MLQIAEKAKYGVLDSVGREAEMCVGDDVTRGGKHEHILPRPVLLYKPMRSDDLPAVTNVSTAPELPPHEIDFRVRYAETDQMGVVYHANYLVWCEMGRTDFIRNRGMSYADIERAGISLAVSELSARFHGAARYDDMIRVRTTLTDLRSRAITFDYLITKAVTGERLVTARTTLVSLDPAGRPVALPTLVRALFAPA